MPTSGNEAVAVTARRSRRDGKSPLVVVVVVAVVTCFAAAFAITPTSLHPSHGLAVDPRESDHQKRAEIVVEQQPTKNAAVSIAEGHSKNERKDEMPTPKEQQISSERKDLGSSIEEQDNHEEDGGVASHQGVATTRRRFPRYGTPEFTEQCSWTMIAPVTQDCTLMLTPNSNENEGLAQWVTKVVAGLISSKLKRGGCQFIMDYGPGVEIEQVVASHPGSSHNWTVPIGFTCEPPNCSQPRGPKNRIKKGRPTHLMVPDYRPAYRDIVQNNIYRKTFQHLGLALPRFDLETGMACAFESLVELSPAVSQFEPNIFTHILPTLRDERNLVLALYFRSGQTDWAANAEKSGNSTPAEIESKIQKQGQKVVPCVLTKEKEFLSNSSGPSYSRVVWLVVSDSPYFKRWVTETYTSPNINADADQGKDGLSDLQPSSVLSREIVTTTSRGVHTRRSRNPSTADFAEGMIDWYLIGESDMVFVNGRGYTFGTTAAMRTNRPLHDVGAAECPKLVSIHEEEAPTE